MSSLKVVEIIVGENVTTMGCFFGKHMLQTLSQYVKSHKFDFTRLLHIAKSTILINEILTQQAAYSKNVFHVHTRRLLC